MICGEKLEYLDASAALTCSVCGSTEQGHIRCANGHYACNTCHDRSALAAIRDLLLATTSTDPFDLAEQAMALPGLPMLGCNHAYIAGGALAAALRNRGGRFADLDIDEVFQRTSRQAHGGYCGLTGVCGITPAVGAVFSVLTGARCGTDEEQRLVMEAATRVSRSISELTGPSCCKAYVRASLEAASELLDERFGVRLGRPIPVSCLYPDRHPHGCREEKCPYYDSGHDEQARPSDVAASDGLDGLTDRAIELGAESAKVIDASSVVVADWVELKCRYGCALHGKDCTHPPEAPEPPLMKRVLGEYKKAILVSGPKGKPLTELIVRLEAVAYRMGYYKAFALTALSSGGGAA